MARLGPAPELAPPRNPCFLYRLSKADPELTTDIVIALDDPTWNAGDLAAAIAAKSHEHPGREAVRLHRKRECRSCVDHGIVPDKATEA
ncbi:MAG: hypothetical protein ABW143_02535 [Acidimicrobiales bacterium]